MTTLAEYLLAYIIFYLVLGVLLHSGLWGPLEPFLALLGENNSFLSDCSTIPAEVPLLSPLILIWMSNNVSLQCILENRFGQHWIS